MAVHHHRPVRVYFMSNVSEAHLLTALPSLAFHSNNDGYFFASEWRGKPGSPLGRGAAFQEGTSPSTHSILVTGATLAGEGAVPSA